MPCPKFCAPHGRPGSLYGTTTIGPIQRVLSFHPSRADTPSPAHLDGVRSSTNARGTEIVHNTFYLPHGLAGAKGARRIVTIHDMISELLPKTKRRLDLRTIKRRHMDQADHIICVSAAYPR